MSKSLGDFDASAVIYGKFSSYQPSTGASFTLAGTPVLSVYKDNSTTQSTSGVTLTVDFDSVTGLNHFAIDTSSDGSFYSAGSFFDIVLTAGSVDGVTISGSVVASFTIRKNSALKPATAGRTVVVDSSGLVDANMVKLGPTGSGTAQTARDIGASVLLSSGTGTGQLNFTSGVVKADPWSIALPGAYASGEAGYILGHLGAAADPWATALPGSYTSGQAGAILPAIKTKTDSLTFTAAGYVDANTLKVGGTTQTARDIGASVLLSSGTGTGQVSLSSGLVKVQINTKTNTALPGFTFIMVDTAGIPRTGLSVSGQVSIDGGAFASCANAVSEISNGFYTVDLATSDMNGKVIVLRFTATGAQDKPITIITTP